MSDVFLKLLTIVAVVGIGAWLPTRPWKSRNLSTSEWRALMIAHKIGVTDTTNLRYNGDSSQGHGRPAK